jgi:hypothetical protein
MKSPSRFVLLVLLSIIPPLWAQKPPKPKVVAEAPPTEGLEAAGVLTVKNWEVELGFRPKAEVQSIVFSQASKAPAKPWHFQKIERAAGPVVLDLHKLAITELPRLLGKPMTTAELNGYIRRHFPEFFDPTLAKVEPLDFDSLWRLESEQPLGAMLNFSAPGEKGEKGVMVLSDTFNDRWALTSVYSGIPGIEGHPIAGNRWFGVTPIKGMGILFFTKGAYRPTSGEPAEQEAAIAAETALWKSLLEKVKSWVEQLGGKAELRGDGSVVLREEWAKVQAHHFFNLEKWQDLDGNWESNDLTRRFRLELTDGMSGGVLVERNQGRKEHRQGVIMNGVGEGSFELQRAQTAELLAFQGFGPTMTKTILASNPKPSLLTISKKGGQLKAIWRGIVVQKTSDGEFDKIVYGAPKEFLLNPAP